MAQPREAWWSRFVGASKRDTGVWEERGYSFRKTRHLLLAGMSTWGRGFG